MTLHFTKFHGFGNDYIVVEERELTRSEQVNRTVKDICHRHYGAGADGIVSVRRSGNNESDFTARIFNADGGEAQISGNGTRCAVAYLYFTGQWTNPLLRLSTPAGIKNYRLTEKISDGHYWFQAEMGKPAFDAASIPMITDDPRGRVANYSLPVGGDEIRVTAVQTGNPHCVIFTSDFDNLNWRELGRQIESHAAFPERTNVEFVKPINRNNIEIRIWERGVGETMSSGTCSAGAAIASMESDLVDRKVSVHTEGGIIEVEWRDDGEIVMTGRADLIYRGEWLG
jgi:diaminopimelate epimerase